MELTASYRYFLCGGATAIASLHVAGKEGEELFWRLNGRLSTLANVTIWPTDGQGPCLAGPAELFKVDRDADGTVLAVNLGGNRDVPRSDGRTELLGMAAAMAGLEVRVALEVLIADGETGHDDEPTAGD